MVHDDVRRTALSERERHGCVVKMTMAKIRCIATRLLEMRWAIPNRTVSAAWVRHLLATSAGVGLDTAEVLRCANLSVSDLQDPDARIAVEAQDRIWVVITRAVGSMRFAEAAAERCGPQSLGVAGLIMAASANVQDAGLVLDRYRHLVGPDYVAPRFQCRHQSLAELVFAVPPELGRRRERGEVSALSALRVARQITGIDWRPIEVRFQHSKPADAADYDTWFGCPVRFGATETAVVLPVDFQYQPLARADAGLVAYLDRHAKSLLEQESPVSSFGYMVRSTLCGLLRNRATSAAEVARKLGTSERSLQRYLRSEGTTYEDILDDTRRALAIEHLNDRSLSLGEIATLLGYSEASPFTRAFRRWMGITPREYRRSLGPVAANV